MCRRDFVISIRAERQLIASSTSYFERVWHVTRSRRNRGAKLDVVELLERDHRSTEDDDYHKEHEPHN